MAEWVKLSTNIFANKKIRILRSYPDGDSLALLWINLICCAGEINDNGMVYLTEGVPYTPDMLAAVVGYDIDTVNTALDVFQKLNMVEVDEEGYITILGWEEHQNAGELAKIKERERAKQGMRKCREKRKTADVTESNEQENNDVTCNNAQENNGVTECYGNVTPMLQDVTRNNDVTNADVTVQNKNKNIYNYDDDNNTPIPNSISRENANSKAINTKAINSTTVEVVPRESNNTKAQDIFALYGNNISPITPILAEKVQSLIADYGEAAVRYGVEAAVEQGVRTYPYVLACAKNYLAEGGREKRRRQKVNDVEGTIAEIIKELDEGGGDIWP